MAPRGASSNARPFRAASGVLAQAVARTRHTLGQLRRRPTVPGAGAFPTSVIDYVVAHELSHLRVMDHSPRFWETVESVMPDYQQLRRQLKDEPVPRW